MRSGHPASVASTLLQAADVPQRADSLSGVFLPSGPVQPTTPVTIHLFAIHPKSRSSQESRCLARRLMRAWSALAIARVPSETSEGKRVPAETSEEKRFRALKRL